MEEVIVKREDPTTGDIFLFYVDENGESQEGTLTGVLSDGSIQVQDNKSFIIREIADDSVIELKEENSTARERWSDEETHRLLMFYNDNKQIFLSGSTKRKHLWAMACKTMLTNKNPIACDMKLRNLKAKYAEVCKNGKQDNDQVFELCDQAFSDDPYIKAAKETLKDESLIKFLANENTDGAMYVKKVNSNRIDEKVQLMLQLYLKYKKNFQSQYFIRNLWDTIAAEIGEESGTYWQKRFLNFKQHYICLLEKSKEEHINWPYFKIYEEIFQDDEDFKRKYLVNAPQPSKPKNDDKWLMTEKVILMKYNYDCYDDFLDPKIPDNFLWTEVGRLLDKAPEICKKKFLELKKEQYSKYSQDDYGLLTRKPLDILCDSIISKDVELELTNSENEGFDVWKTNETDELVQFVYDHIEMFKDFVCHFVCWGIIARNHNRSVVSCRKQWEELVVLYKSILEDKKENPDMQIDWRYIELFDRIFDYGMDTKLLNGYEKLKEKPNSDKKNVNKVSVSGNKIKMEHRTDDDSYDEMDSAKKPRRSNGDSKAFKILEYYQRNKDKFSTTGRNKHNLWTPLSRQLGISESQCAHRFRNLKQVYTAYVQREINRPEMPIVWPYYSLCKKVFGYRAIKNKLKNDKNYPEYEEWTASEIKQLIDFFTDNFHDISNNIEDITKWSPLASCIDKSEVSCKDKFVELRKSYRKLKTQISRNPNVKISWKYFNTFEDIYNAKENGEQESMEIEEQHLDDSHEDDDYQCIIVLPEGADISDIDSSQIIIQENQNDSIDSADNHEETYLEETNPDQEETDQPQPVPANKSNKWSKLTKKRLLVAYINYVRRHKGKEINRKDMWNDIGEKLNKNPVSCKKMFGKLKNGFKERNGEEINSPYQTLLEKVLKLKPKFAKPIPEKNSEEEKVYKNVQIPTEKLEKALQYYLQHIEDFVNPKFEKKFLWTELANYISEPVSKVFNKINFLKQTYNNNQVLDENEKILEFVKEITAKEIAINLVTEIETASIEHFSPRDWSDEETENLLEWYLGNLDKFKNPKFVRSYLWVEVSKLLNRSPLDCSKKMLEIRSQYRNMVKEKSENLDSWKFYGLCQKIYGTGKKGNPEKME